jgi:uncharacterized membrane protein
MATSILNRDLPLIDDFHPIPTTGVQYAPLPNRDQDGRITASAVQTILADPQDLYRLWRDTSWIPRWQEYVLSVAPLHHGRSHWVMGNPEEDPSTRIEFESEMVEDIPGEIISWRSLTPGIEQTGSVTFAPTGSGRGTLVVLVQTVRTGFLGLSSATAGIGKRSPKQLVTENLRHFKQLVETGEIPTVEGQPHGPRGAVGNMKQWIYGEHLPTPLGTSDAA